MLVSVAGKLGENRVGRNVATWGTDPFPTEAQSSVSRVIYHVMNRGDRREPIFHGDQDRLLFLDTLAEACEKTDWQRHAWCLMNNPFHVVMVTPRGNLVDGTLF